MTISRADIEKLRKLRENRNKGEAKKIQQELPMISDKPQVTAVSIPSKKKGDG